MVARGYLNFEGVYSYLLSSSLFQGRRASLTQQRSVVRFIVVCDIPQSQYLDFFLIFYPSARWARRGIVVPFVRRRLCRRRTYSFGYYTNMVQQNKFIIHTNIQSLPAVFFTQGQRSKVKDLKTNSCLRDNLKNNY